MQQDLYVNSNDNSLNLIKTLIIKRSKQRFEVLGIARYVLRICMLISRISVLRIF